MKIYESLILLLGFLAQVIGTRITLDDEAQALCKKYKMSCKTGKVCAVQHFDVPKHITIPVCIPLSFVPASYKSYVRNLICQLPPDPGRCFARYIRWYYNIHSRDCSHFRYGGCHGNQNNFMSKSECEKSCLATPSIKLFEGGQSALVQMKPSVLTAPVYEPPQTNSYEALNSVVYSGGAEKARDRYRVARHRANNKNQADEANTRKRRRLDREKERRRRERRKEKKRLKRLRLRQRNLKKGKKSKKNKKKRKKVNKPIESVNETEANGGDMIVKPAMTELEAKTKDVISNEIEANKDEDSVDNTEKEKKRKRKKRRNKDRKKRDRYRSRRHRPNYRRKSELRASPHGYFSILDKKTSDVAEPRNSLTETLT